MSDTTDKIRGVVLAALMVLSVFGGTIAFSGAAAAATNASLSSNGQSVTVTQGGTTEDVLNFTLTDDDGGNGDLIAVDNVSINSVSGDLTAADIEKIELVHEDSTVVASNSSVDDLAAIEFEEFSSGADDSSNTDVSGDGNNQDELVINQGASETLEVEVTLASGAADSGDELEFDASVTLVPQASGDYEVFSAGMGGNTATTSSTGTVVLDTQPGAPTPTSAVHWDADDDVTDTDAELEISFDEALASGSQGTITLFNADGEQIGQVDPAVSDSNVDEDQQVYVSNLETYGNLATVQVSGFQDAAGNEMETTNLTVDDGEVSVFTRVLDATSDNPTTPTNVTFFQGGNILLNFGTGATDYQFDLTQGDTFAQRSTGPGSQTFVLNTEEYSIGDIFVDRGRDQPDNSGDYKIELRSLNLEATLAQSGETFETDQDLQLTGVVSARDTSRDVEVTVFAPDGSVAGSTTVTIDGDGSVSYALNVPSDDLAVGDYTVVAQDVLTGNQVDAGTVTVEEAGQGASTFAENVQEDRGDIAEITVQVTETDTASVAIGEPDDNFRLEFNVTDADGDGEVTVAFNTFDTQGTDAEPVSVVPDDNPQDPTDSVSGIDVLNATSDLIDAGPYNMYTSAGADAHAETVDNPDEVATLQLDERSTGDMVVWTASGNTDFGSLEDITAAREDGNLTQDSSIAAGDKIVHQINVSGIYGGLANASGDSEEERFLDTLGDDLELTVVQQNPERNSEPKVLDVDDSAGVGAINIIADDDTNQLFVIVDSGAAEFDREVSDADVAAGDQFEPTLYVGGAFIESDSAVSTTTAETASNTFTLVARNADVDVPEGDVLEVSTEEIEDGQLTVTGTSTLAAGSQLSVRVQSTQGVSPAFFDQVDTRVQADGTFSATLGVEDAQAGADFEVTVRAGGSSLETQTGQIVAPTAPASVTFDDQTTSGETVTVASATLEDGGFVVIHRVANGSAGEVIGASGFLSAGTSTNVTIQLDEPITADTQLIAMAHTDDGDRAYEFPASDGPYTFNGSAIVDQAQVSVPSAEFQVAGLNAPAEATIGDTIQVTATVENVGDAEGTETVEFRFAGSTLLTQEVTLAGGASESATFDVPLSSDTVSAGTFTHGIFVGNSSQTAEITLNAQTTTTTTEPTETTTEPTETTTEATTTTEAADTTTESGDGGPGFTVALALIAVIAAALLAVRRD